MTKTTWVCAGLSLMLGMLTGLGCQGSTTKSGSAGSSAGQTSGTSSGAGQTSASSGGAGGGSAGKTGSSGGSGGAKAGSSGSTEYVPMCHVDFPCTHSFRCVDNASYEALVTDWDCSKVCGTRPCGGGVCRVSGSPIACPMGTQCVTSYGFDDVKEGCQPILDAGADAQDSMDAQGADLGVKTPLDASSKDVRTTDTTRPDVVAVCVAGERRCQEGSYPVMQTCSADGQWQSTKTCDFACRAGACVGGCDPGLRRRCRATGNVPQACDSSGTWVDEAACSGNTPYCATGQCVAACLNEGQDCSAATTACCAGSECVSASTDIQVGSSKFTCKAIPACAASGATCSANSDCCEGLDCTAGKCAAKQTTCLDAPADGVCGGTSGATCCPGTECTSQYSFEPLGCTVSAKTVPSETGCPRDIPGLHESCRAAKFGLKCTYSDWSTSSGIFFACTCSYHGWSCTKGHYVH